MSDLMTSDLALAHAGIKPFPDHDSAMAHLRDMEEKFPNARGVTRLVMNGKGERGYEIDWEWVFVSPIEPSQP